MSGSDVVTYRAGLLGAPGTGKSTLLWLLCLALPRVFLFDPHHDHRCPPGGRLYRPTVAADRNNRKGGRYYDDVELLAQKASTEGDCTVALEEASTCVRLGQQSPPTVDVIAAEGRHLPNNGAPTGVGIIVSSQRPKQLPPQWWDALDHLFVFRVSNPRQLQWVRDNGFPAEKVARLLRGQFFHLDLRTGDPPHFHAHALDGACGANTAAAAA